MKESNLDQSKDRTNDKERESERQYIRGTKRKTFKNLNTVTFDNPEKNNVLNIKELNDLNNMKKFNKQDTISKNTFYSRGTISTNTKN
jgi:hypothetical protein